MNTRLVIHELGHAFDFKVCADKKGAPCTDMNHESVITSDLKRDVASKPFLKRDGYGKTDDDPNVSFNGFAGGQFIWQFTSEKAQTNFSTHPREVWADMFLGWVYDNLGPERKNYMNEVMPEYLDRFK